MNPDNFEATESDVKNANTSVSFFLSMTAFFLACSFAVPFIFTPFAIVCGGFAVLSKMVSLNLEMDVNRSDSSNQDVKDIKKQLKEGSSSCPKELPETTN